MRPVDFGDTVRIRSTPETIESGHAGQIGTCLGFTTPSATHVEVIGPATDDYALAVEFGSSPIVWFDPPFVEFVDVGAGQVATIGEKKFVRGPTGKWEEVSNEP